MLRLWMLLWVIFGIVKFKLSNFFFYVYCLIILNIYVVYFKSLCFYLLYNIFFGRLLNDVIILWLKFLRVFNIKCFFFFDVFWECKLN